MKPQAVTYGRQSMGKARSITEQLGSGRARTDAEGWKLLAEYQDKVSASRYATRARDDWPKLLAALERPDVGVLWLWETSRGDRRLSTWAGMLETCRDHGVRVYVETHGRLYDPANARDMRTLSEDGVDNAYESDKISDRTLRAMRANAADGRPHSIAPWGYQHLHDERTGQFLRRVVEPTEAGHIRELFARLRQGHALRAIERDWATRGIVGRSGKPFSAQTLRQLALNPAYTALRVHLTVAERKAAGGRERLDTATEGDWEPIVGREEFYAVRAILTAPERKTSRPGRAVHLLSVSPAARCGVCGGPLATEHRPVSGGGGRVWMYFCQRSGHVRVAEADLDELATDAILAYMAREDNFQAFAEPQDEAELAKVRGELATLQAARDDLADAVRLRGKSPAWAMAADEAYEQDIAALEARERELTAPDELRGLLAPGPDVAARWAAAPLSTRREVARLVLSAGRVGIMKIQRRHTAGSTHVPAAERVTWERS